MAVLDYPDGRKVFGSANTKYRILWVNGAIELDREDGERIQLTTGLVADIEAAMRAERYSQARMNA